MTTDWEKKVEGLLRQTGTRVHAPNGLPIRCVRWDGLMLEHEGAEHRDYLFPVDAESSDPPEIDAATGNVLWWNKASHALIYTDSNVALTLCECCYHLWHLSRDGEHLSGTLHDKSWRLTAESVDKIVAYCKEREITFLHPNAREDAW